MKGKNFYILLAVVAVGILILIGAGRFLTPGGGVYWKDTAIRCLITGHQNITLHIHPHLRIVVNGADEDIPASVGVSPACMAEVHTHDATGTLHVESSEADKSFTLQDFFDVWGSPLMREGYSLDMTVDGENSDALGTLVLRDGQNIILTYTPER
mgnify:CR=1 FL=1